MNLLHHRCLTAVYAANSTFVSFAVSPPTFLCFVVLVLFVFVFFISSLLRPFRIIIISTASAVFGDCSLADGAKVDDTDGCCLNDAMSIVLYASQSARLANSGTVIIDPLGPANVATGAGGGACAVDVLIDECASALGVHGRRAHTLNCRRVRVSVRAHHCAHHHLQTRPCRLD